MPLTFLRELEDLRRLRRARREKIETPPFNPAPIAKPLTAAEIIRVILSEFVSELEYKYDDDDGEGSDFRQCGQL